jgi:UDP-2,3-diacylglucosamine pyrophosphatase LpxH
VLSDVHLGDDIGDLLVGQPPARSRSVDEDLCALLEHYRQDPVDSAPWTLIINGDFIDFVGISLDPANAAVSTEPTPEERAHGLGSAEDHARVKLARVAERHHAVFRSLAAFVGAGNRLMIVSGNHDREFHWPGVRSDLREVLVRALRSGEAPITGDDAGFLERIRFAPWFLWIEGVAFIEHGHQYDTFCSTEHALAPLSPGDPRRLSRGFTDVLLRFVVHNIPVVRECNHERMGVCDYIALAARLGLRGGANLFFSYVKAIVELFRLRTLSLSEAASAPRQQHERRLSQFAVSTGIELHRLRRLVELQVCPVTRTIRGIMASLLVDELAVAGASIAIAGTLLGVLGLRTSSFAWTGALIACAWWVGHVYLTRTRHVDPQQELAARAGPLAQLFPAAFVVMGHTHVPVRAAPDARGATYVNTGSWAEAEGTGPDASFAHRAARTHLVIRVRDSGPEAELLAWDSCTGPKHFSTG